MANRLDWQLLQQVGVSQAGWINCSRVLGAGDTQQSVSHGGGAASRRHAVPPPPAQSASPAPSTHPLMLHCLQASRAGLPAGRARGLWGVQASAQHVDLPAGAPAGGARCKPAAAACLLVFAGARPGLRCSAPWKREWVEGGRRGAFCIAPGWGAVRSPAARPASCTGALTPPPLSCLESVWRWGAQVEGWQLPMLPPLMVLCRPGRDRQLHRPRHHQHAAVLRSVGPRRGHSAAGRGRWACLTCGTRCTFAHAAERWLCCCTEPCA